ncbi:penicillin-binding protein 2 [Pandoraea pulmonicola]|uniref:Peptidoglycan D,D-transpeptidase MrdA n=1 Tax=Pandoraea pulmonicola TaxID=93221 RepID=A0AAJ4ZCS8_PANPU|nr:penicillin-binding protein 2 [Pandoraea pulmonicola]AJC20619.1 penicillin-binding protein 2 [Pandoraea pulmonicola]SUA90910.1 Penicillin-binding protein 2 [Pandoraea pulmonicola]
MTEFKNPQQQLQTFHLRVTAAALFVLICFSLLGVRFVYLQVFRHNQYALQADENRVSLAPIVPNRGVIMDRNGVVLARNYSAYTLEITPSKIGRPLEDLITDLSDVIEITPRDRARFKKLMDDSKSFESLPIRTRLTDEEVARFTAQRFRFPGVDVHARLFRQYPLGETAAHVIGYIGRISQRDRQRIEAMSDENDSDSAKYDIRRDANNYKGTDYIGKIGVEQSYETQLHGITGFEEIEVTAGGRPVRTISRTPATPGDNLVLSIDIKLQQVAEQAFAGRRGAVVAIEPKTGDVLAFVSAPSFDPNLFVEGIDQQNWDALNNSPDRPLLNRPLRGTYPIGSTYKPFMALAALELGKRTTNWGFQDTGSFTLGNHTFRNDVRNGQGWIDMYRSIVVSNDTYYYMLAHDLGVNAIHDFMAPLGFGQLTGIDIEGEARGILPSTEWKRKAYKKPAQQKWYDGETISLGIGQGYNSFTILQLAHATATLANNGVVMKPHLVKAVEDPVTHSRQLTVPHESARLPYKQADVDFVKRAMVGVIKEGTGRQAFAGAPYEAGGKTGTAQVYSLGKNEKYNHNAIPEFKRDHALFIAFAPAEDPKIAIALIVENAGWGGAQAGPVARRLLDYYLIDEPKERAAEAAALQAASSPGAASGAMAGVSATPDAPPASAAERGTRMAGTALVPRTADAKASAAGAVPAPDTPKAPTTPSAPQPQRPGKPAVSPTVADEARHRAAIRAQGGTP